MLSPHFSLSLSGIARKLDLESACTKTLTCATKQRLWGTSTTHCSQGLCRLGRLSAAPRRQKRVQDCCSCRQDLQRWHLHCPDCPDTHMLIWTETPASLNTWKGVVVRYGGAGHQHGHAEGHTEPSYTHYGLDIMILWQFILEKKIDLKSHSRT